MADGDLYQTVNGPKTEAQMKSELYAAGWQGPAGGGSVPASGGAVVNAYVNTAGGTAIPINASALQSTGPAQTAALVKSAGSGGGGGSGGTTAADQAAVLNAFQQSSGFSLQDLAERKREFDATLEWQKQMWANQGMPQLEIQQRAQALAEQEFQAQNTLAQQNFQLSQAGVTGYYTPYTPPPTPAATPGTSAGGTAAPAGGLTQDSYVAARVKQLTAEHGYNTNDALGTATAEWTSGNAQMGNVAFGMPAGLSTATTAMPPVSGVAPATGGPTRDQAVQQRAAELVAMGQPQAQALSTAAAEFDQGFLQSGNVAGGTKVSFAATPAAGGTAATGTAPAAATPTLANLAQQAQFTGLYNGAPTMQAQQQAFEQEQARAGLGLQYLQTAANMGGPADIFQADDFTRGAAANGTPTFLRALQNNTGLAAFGATSGAAPTALTAGGLMDRLSGGTVPGTHDAALNSINSIAQAGGAALGPQAMEQLNPDEIAAMGSGFKKLGYSLPAFLQQYTQSRIGQGAAQAA